MPTPSGNELEDEGKQIFTQMGLRCFNPLNQVRLRDIDPNAPFGRGEHLEFDFLIPYGRYCLIGEITSRSRDSNTEAKYSRFRKNFDFVRQRLPFLESQWSLFGIQPSDIGLFRQVAGVKGFFIDTSMQKFDLNLTPVNDVACFYKVDWANLSEYAECIGGYARNLFLGMFGILDDIPRKAFYLRESSNSLMRTPDKKISSKSDLADLYTFEASPYELLPTATVHRRDMLPDLSSKPSAKYQRPLIINKLKSIRRDLIFDPDFMFPSSILVVLSQNCQYTPTDKTLLVPDTYGSISVIDGQHRLFSYADDNIKQIVNDKARIMVTAIHYKTSDPALIARNSARIFIEINTNQTRVPSSHTTAIAYDILEKTDSKSLAAKVILVLNERLHKAQYGLFETNQTSLGVWQTTTIVSALRLLVDCKQVAKLKGVVKGKRGRIVEGYKKLFEVDSIDELEKPQVMIDKSYICLEKYFSYVSKEFNLDWPKRGQIIHSSLKHSKLAGAFIMLLREFVREGCDWRQVKQELRKLRDNLMKLRHMQKYNKIIFAPQDSKMPDAKPSMNMDFRFLNENRQAPLSLARIKAKIAKSKAKTKKKRKRA